MAEHWTITVPDGDFHAYVARPATPGPWPAVVAIQEIFGINHVMREVCAWLAGQGYLAVCPDLFWRLERGVDITDKSQGEWDKALDLMGRFDVDKGVEVLGVAGPHLVDQPGVERFQIGLAEEGPRLLRRAVDVDGHLHR